MSTQECTGEYWQPNQFLGTSWVCQAEGHDVRVGARFFCVTKFPREEYLSGRENYVFKKLGVKNDY